VQEQNHARDRCEVRVSKKAAALAQTKPGSSTVCELVFTSDQIGFFSQ
jgi:hypothetical protein